MPVAQRTQADDMQKAYSELTQIDCSDEIDRTHQEFKKEADINDLMTRFGVGQRQPQFGDMDFSLDLQSALAAVREAKDVHARMPDSIRKLYPTWRSLLNAANTGDLKKDLAKLEADQKTKTVPPDQPPKEEAKQG